MKLKKSQMEILGLAIVLEIIMLGALFVAKFMLNKKPVEYRKSALSSQIASNTINTMLKTTVEGCSGATMRNLLQDCSKLGSIQCGSKGYSCEVFENDAESILVQTLKAWGYTYHFSATTNELPPSVDIKINPQCDGEKKSEQFIVPSGSPIIVKLDICLG